MKEKTDKMDFIKIKHLCFALPKIVKKTKRQATDSKYLQNTYLMDCYPKYTKDS